MESLLDVPWGSLVGWGGVLTFILVSWAKGLLTPKRDVDRLVQILEARLADRDKQIAEMKATNDAMDKRNDMLAEQVRELVQLAHTSNAALQALPIPRGESVK